MTCVTVVLWTRIPVLRLIAETFFVIIKLALEIIAAEHVLVVFGDGLLTVEAIPFIIDTCFAGVESFQAFCLNNIIAVAGLVAELLITPFDFFEASLVEPIGTMLTAAFECGLFAFCETFRAGFEFGDVAEGVVDVFNVG